MSESDSDVVEPVPAGETGPGQTVAEPPRTDHDAILSIRQVLYVDLGTLIDLAKESHNILQAHIMRPRKVKDLLDELTNNVIKIGMYAEKVIQALHREIRDIELEKERAAAPPQGALPIWPANTRRDDMIGNQATETANVTEVPADAAPTTLGSSHVTTQVPGHDNMRMHVPIKQTPVQPMPAPTPPILPTLPPMRQPAQHMPLLPFPVGASQATPQKTQRLPVVKRGRGRPKKDNPDEMMDIQIVEVSKQ